MAAYTARQAAGRLRVTRTAVHLWHTRGWIDPEGQRRHLTVTGHTEQGARLYDWADLLDAERDTRAKRQRSHRASRRLIAA